MLLQYALWTYKIVNQVYIITITNYDLMYQVEM